MALIKNWAKNPKDGIATFQVVNFYEADDANGTNATLIATVAIDQTTDDRLNPGITTYTYTSGSTSKYYASKWANTAQTLLTDFSEWVKGGEDRIDNRFKREMDDSAEAVWSASLRGDFKDAALESLYPEFFLETHDTSLSIDNDPANDSITYEYDLPYGVFDVVEVSVGYINTDSNNDRNFKIVKPEYWRMESNRLVFDSLSGLTNDYPIRMVVNKKYTEIGEVPTRLDFLIMLHMKMSAYLDLADDFPRFKTWARLQEGTKVSFENLRVHAREFEKKFDKEKARLKDMSRSSYTH